MSLQAIGLLITIVCCYTMQGFFSKLFSVRYQGPPAAATPVYASVTGAACALVTLAVSGFSFDPSAVTWAMGLSNGVILFLYNLAAVNAARTGPYSLQSLIATLGHTTMPLIAGIFIWQDVIAPIHWAGIGVMMLSFFVFNLKGLRVVDAKKGYFGWVTLLALSNGLFGILMAGQQRIMLHTQRNEMIIISYFTSALISAVYLFLSQRGRVRKAYNMGKVAWIALMMGSVVVATAVNLMMRTLELIPASILYTINNGGVLVFSVLLGSLFFKEKFTREKAFGLVLAVAAFFLLGRAA